MVHEASRLSFLAGDTDATAVLLGAVKAISARPNVTVQASIIEQSAQLLRKLEHTSDRDAIGPGIRRGENIGVTELLDLVDEALVDQVEAQRRH